ncbi:hypothetical protein F8S13_21180 [Chloroflexia bacterium SDU3-3]|nr:hypothetical protein F8S13_21180 [Chloroflexia bacterium SDU3-3]
MAKTAREASPKPLQLARFSRLALIVGAVSLLIAIVSGFVVGGAQFFQSYLYGFIYWFAISMGGLGLLILQYLVGGRWGQTIKRILEAMAQNLYLMAALFVPIIISIFALPGAVYPWSDPSVVASNHILQLRQPYMNPAMFSLRAVIFFAAWIGLTYLFTKWSDEQDRTANPAIHSRFGKLAGGGVVLFMLTYSFAMIDWGMTTELVWYSTMYPVLYVVISALTGIAFSAFVLSFIYKVQPLAKIATANRFHDLGSLGFAFTVLWTYVNFSQFLIIYSANISEEAEFYVVRSQGGWQYLGYIVTFCCFILPFFALLSRRTKRSPERMRWFGAFILVAQMLNVFWQLTPAFHHEHFSVSITDLAMLVGIGGLWVGAFLYWLGRRPLVAENDPRQQDCLVRSHTDAFEKEKGPKASHA